MAFTVPRFRVQGFMAQGVWVWAWLGKVYGVGSGIVSSVPEPTIEYDLHASKPRIHLHS